MMDDETLKKYAFVIASTYRVNTIKALKYKTKIPRDISKDSGILANHISKILRELKDKGIVVCINEEVHKGRLYRLTDTGIEIYEKLIEQENDG